MTPVARSTDEDFLKEISEVLEGNGAVPQATKDRLILTALAQVYRIALFTRDDFEDFRVNVYAEDIKIIRERLRNLETKNIIMLVEKHPKWTAFIILMVFITVNLWDFRQAIFVMLGFPANLIP